MLYIDALLVDLVDFDEFHGAVLVVCREFFLSNPISVELFNGKIVFDSSQHILRHPVKKASLKNAFMQISMTHFHNDCESLEIKFIKDYWFLNCMHLCTNAAHNFPL